MAVPAWMSLEDEGRRILSEVEEMSLEDVSASSKTLRTQ